jgi:hypothetical protein
VNRHGARVRYVALAAAWRKNEPQPSLGRGPAVEGNPNAVSLVVEGGNFRDLILWQPEEVADQPGQPVAAGQLKTDALMAVVRTDRAGNVIGYAMGEGRSLEFAGRRLARSPRQFSVSADGKQVIATGPRHARQGLAPEAAAGSFWLPDAASEIWADGERVHPSIGRDHRVVLGSASMAAR